MNYQPPEPEYHMPLWVGLGNKDEEDQDAEDAWRINKPIRTLRLFAEQEEDGDYEDDYTEDAEP